MAQGVAWAARELGVPATVVVPDHAPQTKLDAIERLGGRVDEGAVRRAGGRRSRTGSYGRRRALRPPRPGRARDGRQRRRSGSSSSRTSPTSTPCSSRSAAAGSTTGIASAVAALRPATRVYAVRARDRRAARRLARGRRAAEVEYTPSFVDGAGAKALLPAMWARARGLLDGGVAVPLDGRRGAVRLLAERARVIAEGAGRARARGRPRRAGGSGKIVCVVSGGNIDAGRLAAILAGETRSARAARSAAAADGLRHGKVHPFDRKRDRVTPPRLVDVDLGMFRTGFIRQQDHLLRPGYAIVECRFAGVRLGPAVSPNRARMACRLHHSRRLAE